VGVVAAETTVAAQLYERHCELVYRYCLRMLGSREEAEDAAQTTFVQALRALRRGIVPTFEQAWLLKIANNECKSRRRAGWRRSQREFASDPRSLEELAEAPNRGDGRLIGVRHALARLPEMQRRALLLREWQGCSYAEIAHELGVSLPAVEALIFRARRRLARELGEETRGRRYALDLGSLLAALKSALGGGAAVKLAAGVAALATVGVVAGGTAEERRSATHVESVAAVERRAPARHESVGVERTLRPVRHATAQPANARRVRKRNPVARAARPMTSAPADASPGAPAIDEAAPASAAPPAEAPSAPTVPEPPKVPEVPPVPPPLPAPLPVEVPQVSVPAVPQLPQVPALPQLPEVPALPDVPDLPVVGDVPILP
jgi:RNA polymerase sigma-70 factor (ECF subfamily)